MKRQLVITPTSGARLSSAGVRTSIPATGSLGASSARGVTESQGEEDRVSTWIEPESPC